MAKEHIDYGYTGSISLPKEIKNMKTAVIKIGGVGLSLKQLCLLSGGGILAFIGFRVMAALKLETMAIVLPILIAVPFILLAFLSINGLAFDDYLVVQWANKWQSTSIRKNNTLNEFEKLEDLYDRSMKSAERKDRKGRLPKRNRKQKEFSQYKSFT